MSVLHPPQADHRLDEPVSTALRIVVRAKKKQESPAVPSTNTDAPQACFDHQPSSPILSIVQVNTATEGRPRLLKEKARQAAAAAAATPQVINGLHKVKPPQADDDHLDEPSSPNLSIVSGEAPAESPRFWKSPAAPVVAKDLHKVYHQLQGPYEDLTFKDLASARRTSSKSAPSSPSRSAETSSIVPYTPVRSFTRDITFDNQTSKVEHGHSCHACQATPMVFRTRCLVCGKLYCKNCVKEAMGSMPEGRKCTSCLGQRYSQRYVARAGKGWWLSNKTKKVERKWARKPLEVCISPST